jgi:hypothetical protein
MMIFEMYLFVKKAYSTVQGTGTGLLSKSMQEMLPRFLCIYFYMRKLKVWTCPRQRKETESGQCGASTVFNGKLLFFSNF